MLQETGSMEYEFNIRSSKLNAIMTQKQATN